MIPKSWIPIAEYAGKYRVSISTLRRRIKAGDVEYSFSEGKYFLRDLPLGQHGSTTESAAATQVTTAPPPQSGSSAESAPAQIEIPSVKVEGSVSNVLATTNRILDELKKAYSLILQEKEQQITQLRAEAADLKTLVRVLESENERLRNQSIGPSVELEMDKDDWLLES